MIGKIITFLAIIIGSLCFDLFFIVIFVNATEVDCLLQPNETYSCNIQTLLVGKIPTFSKHIENVVDIKTESDSCDDGCSYRAEFVMRDGSQEALDDVYTDRGPVTEEVNTFHAQMVEQQSPIAYRKEPAWWVLLLIGGLSVMTLILAPLSFLRRR